MALRLRETVLKIVEKLFVAVVALVFLLFGYVMYEDWNVRRWDAKIDALCAANGGKDVATRVYETAMAPETKEYFVDQKPLRYLRIPERSDGQKLRPEYQYVLETRVVEVLRERDPSVVKFVQRIVRVSDDKVLGENFGYQRAGGGLNGPDPGTNHSCPSHSRDARLDVAVFLNHPLRSHEEKK